MKNIFPLILLLLLIAIGCSNNIEEPHKTTPYNLEVPRNFPKPYLLADNPLTEEGVKLGRMLYYDPILGTNGRSCSSCHKQEQSFTVPFLGPGGHAIPPHINLAFKPAYTWTGFEEHLDYVAIIDLTVPDFIAPDATKLLVKLREHPEYPKLFREAFNIDITKVDAPVRNLYISYALAQFMRTITSHNSRFDKYMRHEAPLTIQEQRGMDIFFTERGDCFHCHMPALLTDNKFHNTGLDAELNEKNRGRNDVTGKNEDWGKFMTPTLRNIELTAPYMHDNRFQTLYEVVNFYSEGVKESPTLDPLMKYAHKGGVQLNEQEKADLVAFLKTFTDTTVLTNPAFSNPHK